jgi:hypothetical protein
MGDFRVVVEAVGGHGCQREKGTGETVVGCDRPGCPDCMAREFVRRLKRSGATVKRAEIQHWPADLPGYTVEGQVHDDLLSGVRTGDFPERARYLAQAQPAAVLHNPSITTMSVTGPAMPNTIHHFGS